MAIENVAPVTVATGTAAAIGSGVSGKTIILQADKTNTGSIFIGGPGVDVTSGIELKATDPPLTIGRELDDLVDLSEVYAIASAASQKLRVLVRK